ncbi:hypothetical protein A2U01_0087217, partial [Trifolium medium]|nr:hypothetical protein [Trifolium medium]
VRTYTSFRTCIAIRGSEVQRFRGYTATEDENASEVFFLQKQKYSDALATPIASS